MNDKETMKLALASFFYLTATPPEQEPVAKYIGECSEGSLVHLYDDVKKGTNFYTTPPRRTWVGLTDEQRSDLVTLHHGWNEYGQAIEAELRSKNT